MQKRKRKIPQINSTSSADIAFLLLVFFLITSSLDPQTGISRRLSPAATEEALRERSEILDRNLLSFTLDADSRIIYKEEPIPIDEVYALTNTFISNPNNLDYLPEKIEIEIEGIGLYPVATNHVISLEVSREARYESYIDLLNEITKAYNELRDNLSQDLFGKHFNELAAEEQEAVRTAYPLHIAESEIKKGEAL